MGEDEVIERVQRLRGERIIRQVSAIFDTRKLGYRSMLVAARAPRRAGRRGRRGDLDAPRRDPQLQREHEYNIWFTLGVPPTSRLGLDRTVELLGELADVEAIRPLPALRFFKIGVDLDMDGGRDPAAKKARPRRAGAEAPRARRDRASATSPRCARCSPTCGRCPSRSQGPAERHGFTVPELLEKAAELQATGQMRRFAAVLYHRSAGFTSNGMGVWKVPEERVDEMGAADGRLPRRLALLPAADVSRTGRTTCSR